MIREECSIKFVYLLTKNPPGDHLKGHKTKKTMERVMQRYNFFIPTKLLNAAREKGAKLNVTTASVIRMALTEFLKKEKKQ